MSFYLRKAFSFGPIRLNLSKSGITPSIGVRGARVGLRAGGRPYIHAGRHGLYYRKSLPAGSSGRRATGAGDRTVLYEDTGLAYGHPERPVTLSVEPVHVTEGAGASRWPTAELGLVALVIIVLASSGPIRWTALILAAVPLTIMVRSAHDQRTKRRAIRKIETALATVSPGDDLPDPARWAVDPATRAALAEATYERWAHEAAISVLNGDLAAAAALDDAGARLEVPEAQRRSIEQAIYTSALLEAVADHDLSEAEDVALDRLRHVFGIEQDDAEEPGLLERFRTLRAVRAGDLPVRATAVPLQRNEVCHLEAPGRLLREQNLRTFQRDGVRHVVRGLVLQREGSLVVTDRRVLLAGEGVFSIPFSRITDIEVDADENLILVHRDMVMTPTILSTPDALLAGAILATAAGH